MQYKAFIGIGSNLGTPAENCEQAIHLLHALPEIEVVARSSLYESEPVGEIEQNWFVNATVAIKTSLTPEALLNAKELVWGADEVDAAEAIVKHAL